MKNVKKSGKKKISKKAKVANLNKTINLARRRHDDNKVMAMESPEVLYKKSLKAMGLDMLDELEPEIKKPKPKGHPIIIEANNWAAISHGGVICLAFKDHDSRMHLAFNLMTLDKQYTRLVIASKGTIADATEFDKKAQVAIEMSDKVVPGRTGTTMVHVDLARKPTPKNTRKPSKK